MVEPTAGETSTSAPRETGYLVDADQHSAAERGATDFRYESRVRLAAFVAAHPSDADASAARTAPGGKLAFGACSRFECRGRLGYKSAKNTNADTACLDTGSAIT